MFPELFAMREYVANHIARIVVRDYHFIAWTEVVPDHESPGAHQPKRVMGVALDYGCRVSPVNEGGIEEAVGIGTRVPFPASA